MSEEILNDALDAQHDLAEIDWMLERVAERLMKHEHEWAEAGIAEPVRESLADSILDALKAVERLRGQTDAAVRDVERPVIANVA